LKQFVRVFTEIFNSVGLLLTDLALEQIVADDGKLLLDDADKANALMPKTVIFHQLVLSITMLHRTVKACPYLSA